MVGLKILIRSPEVKKFAIKGGFDRNIDQGLNRIKIFKHMYREYTQVHDC
jgi:hypothetical protein